MGEALTEDEVDELIRQADQNKEGKIKYEEFVSNMMSIETNDEKQDCPGILPTWIHVSKFRATAFV